MHTSCLLHGLSALTPWQCDPHRDHVHPALGCCWAAVVTPLTLENAVQDLATVLSPGSPGVCCPCAVGLGSGGVRRAARWDELWDRLAVALGAPH